MLATRDKNIKLYINIAFKYMKIGKLMNRKYSPSRLTQLVITNLLKAINKLTIFKPTADQKKLVDRAVCIKLFEAFKFTFHRLPLK